jgi:hypothetical protein
MSIVPPRFEFDGFWTECYADNIEAVTIEYVTNP